MLQHVEGQAVEVVQDLVHLVGTPPGGALAGRAARTQRPDAAGANCTLFVLRACGVAGFFVLRAYGIRPPRPPAGEAPGVSGQVVERSAQRLALRLQALGAALDDLPGQAKRFARWKARTLAGRTCRAWPLRPGRPPGQRPARRRTHEVHEILHDLHGLAFDVLEHPDTS